MDKQTRSEKNREKKKYWRSHIGAWKKSGLSQIDYCKRNNLSRHRFTYWKNRDNKKPTPMTFIPVLSKASPPSFLSNNIAPLKILIGDQYRIEIGDGFSPDTLTRLMDTLERM